MTTVNPSKYTSTKPLGTLGSTAFILAATIYFGNHDRNHQPCELYNPHAGAVGMLLRINGEFTIFVTQKLFMYKKSLKILGNGLYMYRSKNRV